MAHLQIGQMHGKFFIVAFLCNAEMRGPGARTSTGQSFPLNVAQVHGLAYIQVQIGSRPGLDGCPMPLPLSGPSARNTSGEMFAWYTYRHAVQVRRIPC